MRSRLPIIFALLLVLAAVSLAYAQEPTSPARPAAFTLPVKVYAAPAGDVPQPFLRTANQAALPYAPHQLLVRFRPGVPKQWMGVAHAAVNAKVLSEYTLVENLQLVELSESVSVEEAIRAYRQQPEVLYAEPNYTVHALGIPNDPRFAEQWALHNTGQSGGAPDADMDAPEAWNLSSGSPAVEVVIIDTGIDFTHPDLAANVDQDDSRRCIGDGNTSVCWPGGQDDNGHGTHVAGTIGAVGNNGVGVAGINWNVKLIACKFLDADGGGYEADAISCLQHAANLKTQGHNIVATSNSWGSPYNYPIPQAEFDAIEAHKNLGILFIAAAGNDAFDNDDFLGFPRSAPFSNVLAVASTTRADALSDFSNFGRTSIHLGAPGSAILSTVPPALFSGEAYLTASGTSMATPHVAGVAALLKAQNPSRTWKQIRNLILAGGDTLPALEGKTLTGKRLNAFGALTCSNSLVQSRLQPYASALILGAGDPIPLSFFSINCDSPSADHIDVTVNPGGQVITLLDDGLAPDREPTDGTFSGAFAPLQPGDFTLAFPGGDPLLLSVYPQTPGTANYHVATAAFNYRTITGTNLNLGDDQHATIVSPFPIAFGGGSYRVLRIGDNGNITFNNSYPAMYPLFPEVDAENRPLPVNEAHDPATLVAPLWDDYWVNLPDGSTGVFWEVTGSAPNRELVVEWRKALITLWPCWELNPYFTFQTVFFENSPNILFNYADTYIDGPCAAEYSHGASATVGVQVSHSLFNQFSFNSATLHNNLALLWELDANPTPGLESLMPDSAVAGGHEFALLVSGSGFVNGSVVRWNDADLQTNFLTPSRLMATVPASNLATPGARSVTVFSPTPGGGTSNGLTFTVEPAPADTPAINSGGAVNAASFAPGAPLAPGSIAAVFGKHLAVGVETATFVPLPMTLAGADLDFNWLLHLPNFFASPLQVNVQIPWDLAGQSQAMLTDTVGSSASAGESVPLALFGPGLFTANMQGAGQGAILIANTATFAAPVGSVPGRTSRPAVRGVDYLEIYCTGLGAVNYRPDTGAAASAHPLSDTTTTPQVTIGGVQAPVLFSGLAPGYVGLYVVTLQVPANTPTGNAVPVVLSIGGVQANTVTIAVQ